MKSFSFEHVFRAPSVAAVFAAYFDPKHALEQDRELDIVERSILEWEDTPDQLRRVCRVVPRRQLPALVRPLAARMLRRLSAVCVQDETYAERFLDLGASPERVGAAVVAVVIRRQRRGAPPSAKPEQAGEVLRAAGPRWRGRIRHNVAWRARRRATRRAPIQRRLRDCPW